MDRLASRTECEAAARHLQSLGRALAHGDAESEELRADRHSGGQDDPELPRRVAAATSECLARETTAREARCVSQITSPEDLDACVR
jgi:hypothetical protein